MARKGKIHEVTYIVGGLAHTKCGIYMPCTHVSAFTAEVTCLRCNPNPFVREEVTVEGISYTRYRYADGSTETTSPCQCFGNPRRVHSNTACPWQHGRARVA